MGIGPLLSDDAARLARMNEHPPAVMEMIPGVQPGTPGEPHPLQRRTNLLLFGRADDQLKGVETACHTLRSLREGGIEAQLTVLGAQPDDLERREAHLRSKNGAAIKLKPFTSDRRVIEAELRGADMVLMPSRHEGFGLVATEAAGYGVPVLVGGHTGVGMFLADPDRVPEELRKSSVVPVQPGQDFPTDQQWAEQATTVLHERPAAHQRARSLRAYLGDNYSWGHAAQELTSELARAKKETNVGQLEPERSRAVPSRPSRADESAKERSVPAAQDEADTAHTEERAVRAADQLRDSMRRSRERPRATDAHAGDARRDDPEPGGSDRGPEQD